MKRLLQRLAPKLAGSAQRTRDSDRVRPRRGHPVQVQIMGRNSIDVLNARDISVTGIGVYVPHRFEGCDVDDEVELVVTLPDQKPFVARGRIRHETHHEESSSFYGFQFLRLSNDQLESLRRYVRSGLASSIE
ncbi:MAG: PilZ domain-containing protein [Myxococcota bacterium]|nr:PilZ domain-containing protein [Myxococcota bacterium]